MLSAKGWCLKLWCWRRFLRVPWTAKRSSQSILEEINPKYSLEGLMLKLKLQYSGHLMWRANSLEKTLMLGKIEGRREKKVATEDEMAEWHHWLSGYEFEQGPGAGYRQGSLACCGPWSHKRHDWAIELSNWEDARFWAQCPKGMIWLYKNEIILLYVE